MSTATNTPKTAVIRLTQINPSKNVEKLDIINLSYTIKTCTALNIDKVTQSVTKAVYRRAQAEKNGLKLGFKPSKPLILSVVIDGKYVINTDTLTTTTGTAAKVKINPSLLAKHPEQEKRRFQDVLKFIIEESETLHTEFKGCFFNPDKEPKTEK